MQSAQGTSPRPPSTTCCSASTAPPPPASTRAIATAAAAAAAAGAGRRCRCAGTALGGHTRPCRSPWCCSPSPSPLFRGALSLCPPSLALPPLQPPPPGPSLRTATCATPRPPRCPALPALAAYTSPSLAPRPRPRPDVALVLVHHAAESAAPRASPTRQVPAGRIQGRIELN